MRILLVANYLPDKQQSMQRFAELLVDSLKAHPHEVRIVRPRVVINRSNASYEDKGKWWGYIDKFVIFPIELKKHTRWADIIHICDHSNAHYVKFIQCQAHIITCHDLIAISAALDPTKLTKRSGKILQNIILRGLKKASYFACVSDNTRNELLKTTQVSPHKAEVIYNGVNYPYAIMTKEEVSEILNSFTDVISLLDSISFVLHVGGNQPYKNRMGILRIYRELRALDDSVPHLVMAGKPWTDEMRKFVVENDLTDFVIEIQNCFNEQLRALYSRAKVFLFPSLAEGFGWPVIEAQACGCPVLTSNFAPLTEIGGDAATYCDPRDEKEAAVQLKKLLSEDEIVRAARVKAGLKNVERFTPQTMIESYLALYRKAIETHSSNAK